MAENREKSLKELLDSGMLYLAGKGVEDAATDAWLLLEEVFQISRSWYFAHSDTVVSGEQSRKYEALIARRGQRIPLQHLIGKTWFYGLPFTVNEHVLIPRQDTEILVEEALKGFVGTIQQVPPVFSACKVEGKRAYELARQGEAVELKSKTLVIDELELLAYDMPYIKIRVVCSKGTYIRALARDIGQALRSGAHLTELIRTRVGEVTLDQCMSPEEIDDFLEENGVIKVEENNK